MFRVTTHAERANHSLSLKKVRAKDMIRSQVETSEEVSAKLLGARSAPWGECMKSVLRARAKSEGGRKARNEILIVSFL